MLMMMLMSAGRGAWWWRAVEAHVLLLLLLTGPALQCGPGRGSGRVRRPRKMTPLVFKQHVPNVSENTLGASGPAKGAITRNDPDFKDLVTNYNPDILFKDEEGSGSDRIMSQRCKDKLNTLAIAVMNRWPNVKLRVTEAWDEDGNHSKDSLHYEGRAVDITTSDRDRSKYGMLARLAVEAGFDWVYYEARSHIHVSVKSDSSITIKTGGCFAGTGMVQLADGQQRPLANVSAGEKVLAMLPDGSLDYSAIYMFLDVDTTAVTSFVTVETETGASLTVTPSHLVYVTESRDVAPNVAATSFAQHLRAGQYLYVAQKNKTLTPTLISAVEVHTEVGYYAPLTKHGTIVVDDVIASCYALIDSPTIAHRSFAPVRMYHSIWDVFRRKLGLAAQARESYSHVNRGHDEGVHWYADMLHYIGRMIITDSHWFRL